MRSPSSSRLILMFTLTICRENLPSANFWSSIMKSSAAFSNLKMMWFGKCNRSSRRSMISIKMNLTKKPEMRWKNGQGSLTNTPLNSKNSIWFALSVANTCLIVLSTLTALKIMLCSTVTPTTRMRSLNNTLSTRADIGSVHPQAVLWTNSLQQATWEWIQMKWVHQGTTKMALLKN